MTVGGRGVPWVSWVGSRLVANYMLRFAGAPPDVLVTCGFAPASTRSANPTIAFSIVSKTPILSSN